METHYGQILFKSSNKYKQIYKQNNQMMNLHCIKQLILSWKDYCLDFNELVFYRSKIRLNMILYGKLLDILKDL